MPKIFKPLANITLIALLIAAFGAVSAQAAGPTRTAFCTEGFNNKRACHNTDGNITSLGPVTLRVVMPRQYKKIEFYQGCILRKKTWITRAYCMDGSYEWRAGKSIGRGTQQYVMRISSNLDRIGKIIKLGVRYYPKNGRGCMRHLVRMPYCQSTLAFKIVR
jgi:hypothetical protein